MRGVLWLGLLVACGDQVDHRCNDTSLCVPDAFDHVCSVVPQSGCQVGEKCTSGHQFLSGIVCVPDGADAIGEPCVVDSESNDTCRAGGYCGSSNVCLLICDSAAPACPDGSYCSLSTNLFIHDNRVVAGVCLPF